MHNKERRQAGVKGIGVYVPERILTNYDLEKMVDTSDEWITTRSGIKERHIVADDESTFDLAFRAARNALADAEIDAGELDLIIVGTVTPDMSFPATACLVQEEIKAKKAGAFDLQAGCTGFMYALVMANNFIAAGGGKHVLVIGAECNSRIMNYKDRNTCVLFGDAAGAVVLGAVPDGYGILSSQLRADGSGAMLLTIPAGRSRLPASHDTVDKDLHYFHMSNGGEVFKFAVNAVTDSCLHVLEAANLTHRDLDFFIPHQANARIIEAAAKRLQLPPEKVVMNIARYGNTSSASLPLALYETLDAGNVQEGNHIVMAAFGAGLTWGSLVMRWYDYRKDRKGPGNYLTHEAL